MKVTRLIHDRNSVGAFDVLFAMIHPTFLKSSSFQIETFVKCTILVKIKEGENSNPPDYHRDMQEYTVVFRGLEFESDAEIEQKSVFYKGLKMLV